MATLILQAHIPISPSINESYKRVTYVTKSRKRINTFGATEKLQKFKEDSEKALLSNDCFQDRLLIDSLRSLQRKHKKRKLFVFIRFLFPTLWKRDVDGGVKAAQDATFKHLELNDNTVVDLYSRKREDRENPRCEIKVYLLEENEIDTFHINHEGDPYDPHVTCRE